MKSSGLFKELFIHLLAERGTSNSSLFVAYRIPPVFLASYASLYTKILSLTKQTRPKKYFKLKLDKWLYQMLSPFIPNPESEFLLFLWLLGKLSDSVMHFRDKEKILWEDTPCDWKWKKVEVFKFVHTQLSTTTSDDCFFQHRHTGRLTFFSREKVIFWEFEPMLWRNYPQSNHVYVSDAAFLKHKHVKGISCYYWGF